MRFARTLAGALAMRAALAPALPGENEHPTGAPVRLMHLQGLPTEEKVVTSALAGLRHREGPWVFLRDGKEIAWSGLMLEPGKKWRGVPDPAFALTWG